VIVVKAELVTAEVAVDVAVKEELRPTGLTFAAERAEDDDTEGDELYGKPDVGDELCDLLLCDLLLCELLLCDLLLCDLLHVLVENVVPGLVFGSICFVVLDDDTGLLAAAESRHLQALTICCTCKPTNLGRNWSLKTVSVYNYMDQHVRLTLLRRMSRSLLHRGIASRA